LSDDEIIYTDKKLNGKIFHNNSEIAELKKMTGMTSEEELRILGLAISNEVDRRYINSSWFWNRLLFKKDDYPKWVNHNQEMEHMLLDYAKTLDNTTVRNRKVRESSKRKQSKKK